MKLKIVAVTGLVFLTINQIMLLGGNEFIQAQTPIDYAHWLLLIGILMTLSLNYIFSNNSFGNLATILTSLGVVALIGQATIDFLWWSYGDNYDGMNALVNQIMNKPSIRIPFMTLGPALFYLGLASHAVKAIKEYPIGAIITVIAVVIIGLGSFTYDSRMVIVFGHVLLTVGIALLIFRKDSEAI